MLREKACQKILPLVDCLQIKFALPVGIKTFSCAVFLQKRRKASMRAIEALNKVIVGILLFLVCVQTGLLFAMKNMQDQAKMKLVENETKADLQCGGAAAFSDSNYWNPLERNYNLLKACDGWACEKSALTWQGSSDEKNLHVVSVKNAPPMRWEQNDAGGVVQVRVHASQKPQVLALSSQSMHSWRLIVDDGAKLEKIIVATPTIVWMEGVPEATKIEYLPKEKMCSYPYSWEEVHNPDNEFRLLMGALKKITGVMPVSFQGALIGRDFVLPKDDDLSRREIASLVSERQLASAIVSPVEWVRTDDRVMAKNVVMESKSIKLPHGTDLVAGAFVLRKHRLYVWSNDSQKYELVKVPLTLPPIEEVAAITHNELEPHIAYVFNEANGGEIYSFNQTEKKWTLLKANVPSAVRALYFDNKTESLYGLVSRGRQFTDMVIFNPANKAYEKKPLAQTIPFDPVRWKWEFKALESGMSLVLHTPLDPKGEIHSLAF